MEENEECLFDPDDADAIPNTFAELDLCIASANRKLKRLTDREIPSWRSTVPATLQKWVQSKELGVQLPLGPFFYPCSGNDYEHALNLFRCVVTEFHFADPFWPVRRGLKRELAPGMRDIVNVNSIGSVVNHPGASRSIELSDQYVVSHQRDGLLTVLDQIPFMSVFYYRGDSSGEGGSGQRWCSPVLLDLVFSRILNGGLLCCDESNSSGPIFRKLRTLSVGETFSYRNLTIESVHSDVGHRNGPMTVWQVTEARIAAAS